MQQIYEEKGLNKAPYLDTLAQVPPSGQKLTIKNLKSRARSKWYTQQIVFTLVDIDSPLNKYYWNAYHCGSEIKQVNKKLTSKYCNTRCCNVCNRIRTAKLMNGYMPQLLKLPQLYFVTLTIPNVDEYELREATENMVYEFTLINRHLREKKGIKISGIRKVEITYNAKKNNYHPHLHLIVDKYPQDIVFQWLQRFPEANIKAQDVRVADKGSLQELFKYTTKIIGRKEGKLTLYANALDTIMQSLQGIRAYQPFGYVRKVNDEVDNLIEQEYEGITEVPFVKWQWDECDWSRRDDNNKLHTLTGYTPPDIEIDAIYT